MERLITFRNGRKVIPIGQGTWKMGKRRNEEIQALRRGVELGMALIDTAEMYGNEDLVGKAVRKSYRIMQVMMVRNWLVSEVCGDLARII